MATMMNERYALEEGEEEDNVSYTSFKTISTVETSDGEQTSYASFKTISTVETSDGEQTSYTSFKTISTVETSDGEQTKCEEQCNTAFTSYQTISTVRTWNEEDDTQAENYTDSPCDSQSSEISTCRKGATSHDNYSGLSFMRSKDEAWMMERSSSAMVVATLIASTSFAGAITVSGGNDGEKGTPNFLKHGSLTVFAIADALALFSSVTSLIMFLAILTARYAEEDFLVSLPRQMIIGMSSLFVAIAALMISYGAVLSIVLGERLQSIFLPLTLVSCVVVALFGMLQRPLLIQMFRSTYEHSIFYRPGDHNYRDMAYKKVN